MYECENCDLTEIPVSDIPGDVETLNLGSNQLTAVTPGMWTGLDSLKHLDLNSNQIARYIQAVYQLSFFSFFLNLRSDTHQFSEHNRNLAYVLKLKLITHACLFQYYYIILIIFHRYCIKIKVYMYSENLDLIRNLTTCQI